MADAVESRIWEESAESQLGLPARLHRYQWNGVAFLCRKQSALLADEMGLGKTVQAAVALALVLGREEGMERALVVSPAALVANWATELEAWASSLVVRRLTGDVRNRRALYALPISVLIGSYDQVRLDALDVIPRDCFDIVILDEAQRIKNPYSRTALACRLLGAKRSWALSATPLENSIEDVRAILRFLDPETGDNMEDTALVARLHGMMLRRRKREVRAELPPVLVQDLTLTLSEPQRQRYDEMWNSRGQEWSSVSDSRTSSAVLLGMITRLKMVCNFDPVTDTSSKLDALHNICEAAGPDARVLVFSQYVRTLKWISRRMSQQCGMVVGGMDEHERRTAIEHFRTGGTPRVLLVSLRAGGVGLNLGEATHVVLFDRWWNPAVENQAMYRAHRFERDEPLHVIRFLTEDSIEERINDVLLEKGELFDEVVDDTSVKRTGFSVEDFMRVLDLSPSATNIGLMADLESSRREGVNGD